MQSVLVLSSERVYLGVVGLGRGGGSEKDRRGLILAWGMTWISLILFGFYDLCTAFIVAVRSLLRGINA